MNVIILLLLFAGAIFFGLATFGVAARWNLVAAGLLCWIVATLIPVIQAF